MDFIFEEDFPYFLFHLRDLLRPLIARISGHKGRFAPENSCGGLAVNPRKDSFDNMESLYNFKNLL